MGTDLLRTIFSADVGMDPVTVKRRLSRGLRLLTEQLADLRPGENPPDSI